MNEKERAGVCLHCTLEKCLGDDECFRERKKLYQREYQASRRRGQMALDREINMEWAEDNREKRNAALQRYREGKDNAKI